MFLSTLIPPIPESNTPIGQFFIDSRASFSPALSAS
jgi:hypothetical protein